MNLFKTVKSVKFLKRVNGVLSIMVIMANSGSSTFAQPSKDTSKDKGTDQLRVKSSQKLAPFISEMESSKQQLDLLEQNSAVPLQEYYKSQTKCETEDAYLSRLYDQFLAKHEKKIEKLFLHVRSKMNQTAGHVDDLRASLEQIKVGPTEMTVQNFMAKIALYEAALDRKETPDFTALGFTIDDLKAGLKNLNMAKIPSTGLAFSMSYNELENHTFYIGIESPFPHVHIETRISKPAEFSTSSSSSIQALASKPRTWVAADQSYLEAFGSLNDDQVWRTIRQHKMTIDTVPIDGVQRRAWLEQKRDASCRKLFSKSYKDGPLGPYVSTKVGKPCPGGGDGVSIRSAKIGIGRYSTADRDVTVPFIRMFDGQTQVDLEVFSFVPDEYRNLAEPHYHIYVEVEYTCGCESQSVQSARISGKAGSHGRFGCGDQAKK